MSYVIVMPTASNIGGSFVQQSKGSEYVVIISLCVVLDAGIIYNKQKDNATRSMLEYTRHVGFLVITVTSKVSD